MSDEQAAKSTAAHERTCVFARREAGRLKDRSRQHRLPVVECDSDVCLFWEFLANVEKNFFVDFPRFPEINGDFPRFPEIVTRKSATEKSLLYG